MKFDEYEKEYEKSWLVAWAVLGPLVYGLFALTLWVMGG